MRNFLFSTGLVALGALNLSCGRATEVQADTQMIPEAQVERFPAAPLRLTTNAIFFWKKGVTPEAVGQMSTLGDNFGLVNAKLGALLDAQKKLPPKEELVAKKTALEGQKTQLETAAVDLEAKIKAETDSAKVEELKKQLAQVQGQLAAVGAGLKKVLEGLGTIAFVEKELKDTQVIRSGIIERMTALSDDLMLPKLIEVTFNPDPVVVVVTDRGPLSTQNFSYEELGGKLRFELKGKAGENWQITAARNRYDLTSKGFLSFYGEVKSVTPSGTRYGIVKFLGKITN